MAAPPSSAARVPSAAPADTDDYRSLFRRLPNATQSAYWLTRASMETNKGNDEEALRFLEEGMDRRAEPWEELQAARDVLEEKIRTLVNVNVNPTAALENDDDVDASVRSPTAVATATAIAAAPACDVDDDDFEALEARCGAEVDAAAEVAASMVEEAVMPTTSPNSNSNEEDVRWVDSTEYFTSEALERVLGYDALGTSCAAPSLAVCVRQPRVKPAAVDTSKEVCILWGGACVCCVSYLLAPV